jgi:NodT family efflux transporter outer membrane factor (OMF) lipoprotein
MRGPQSVLCVLAELILLTAISGCMVGPDYQRPTTAMPEQFSRTEDGQKIIEWWKTFQDPQLNDLIERAAKTNLDVRAAEARLRQARALENVAVAGFYPSANFSGSYTRSLGSQITSASSASRGQRTDLYQAGFDAAWEVDVFGGVRRQIEAADANVTAAVEDRRDVMVTLLGEIATDYIQLRGYQERIKVAQDNTKSEADTLHVIRQKVGAGIAPYTRLNVEQTEALVATTEATIPPLEASARQTIYALSILLGEQPMALVKELEPRHATPMTAFPKIPLGLPSQLLERRPDVRQAEAQLHAATANIGVATADLFPKFSLTGSIGQESNRAKNFFNTANEFWAFGPSFSWPVLDFGAIRANIRVQDALQEQALIAYEQAVLTSLSDVENTLVGYDEEQSHLNLLHQAVVANQAAVDTSNQQLHAGTVDFLIVLTSEQNLFQAQDLETQSRIAISADVVSLYKALGGGWEAFEGDKSQHDVGLIFPATRPTTIGATTQAGGGTTQPGIQTNIFFTPTPEPAPPLNIVQP